MSIRMKRTKGHHVIETIGLVHQVASAVNQNLTLMRQVSMVNNFGQIIEEHSVSAPVIATMRAVPDFDAAVRNFPEVALYNRVPHHRSDEAYSLAMESLGEIAESNIVSLLESANTLALTVDNLVKSAGGMAQSLKGQILRDRLFLETTDVSDDEIALMQTTTLSDDSLGVVLAGLESYYDAVAPFNADSLRANPETISQEVDGIKAMVDMVGESLGLALTQRGLVDAPKSADYLPSTDGFEQKGFNKAGLIFALDRVDGLCDQLIALADRSEEFSNALSQEAKDLPESLETTDVNYGAEDHITLMNCYATMMAKVIHETATVANVVLSAIDPIAEIAEAGEDALVPAEDGTDLTPVLPESTDE